jgi:hypothetical protein
MASLCPLRILTLSLVTGLAACGGGRMLAGSSGSPPPSGGADHVATTEYGGPPPADTARSSSSVAAPPPAERPGLGTVFGENLSSSVATRPFVRDADAPFAAVAIHYNDAEGVQAQAAYLGGAAPSPLWATTPAGGISVSLADASGAVLPGVRAGNRTIVVGTEGERYDLVVQNGSPGRFEVVASVDGLDVVDGRPADLGKRGYILEPYGSLVIDGFRRSEDWVAAFRFGRVGASYAARSGDDRNVGVVGFAFFAEEGSRYTSDELGRRDGANPFPGDRAYAAPPR